MVYPGCDLDELCNPIVVGCDLAEPSECTPEDLTETNPALLDCHRDALLSGGAGFIRWELPYPRDAGAAGQRAWVVLAGDGSKLGTPEATLRCLYAPVTDEVVTYNEAYDFPFD